MIKNSTWRLIKFDLSFISTLSLNNVKVNKEWNKITNNIIRKLVLKKSHYFQTFFVVGPALGFLLGNENEWFSI